VKNSWLSALVLLLAVISLVFAGIKGFGGRTASYSSQSSPSSQSQQSSAAAVLEVVSDYYDAFNNGDMERLDELLADDVVVIYPRAAFDGKESAMELYQNMTSAGQKISCTDITINGNIFKCSHVLIHPAGEEFTGTILIELDGKLIQKIQIIWDEQTMEKIENRPQPGN
jgi:hypothetical protein